jgi:hypothetical protein
MLQLKNTTPFAAHIAVLPDERGIDTLYVTIKATFTLGARLEVADPQPPVLLADEYWGEPGQSSLKYAADVHLAKPSTDIALVGQAHSPGRKPVSQLDVSLAVAGRKKVLRVYGDREWRPGFACIPARATSPAPFATMPLVYERAFGGLHEVEGKKPEILFEPRNPVGQGFVGKRKGRDLKGLPLPNLEDPKQPIRGPKHRPAPAAFGFIAPAWEPRKSFAGTYDDAWLKKRAPYLPKDFDPRFFNAAHPDLVTERYLEGGEKVEALNVTPGGVLKFRLPACQLAAVVRIAGSEETPALNLETVLIEPDDARLSLLWRGAVPCDKRALKVEEIGVTLEQLVLDGRAG